MGESVCVCVMVVEVVGSMVNARAKFNNINSLQEHQSANTTATHSSTVHSPQFDRHSPCIVEVATTDRAMFMA